METRKGFTLIELIVVIAIIAMLLAILMPSIGKPKLIAMRIICETNLKGLGTAMTVYSNDYDDNYPQLPGTGPWSKELGFDFFLEKPDFKPGSTQANTTRTIPASWYLLVKYADVSCRGFVCPVSDQEEFDGRNPQNRDFVDLWDFGPNPYKHISYAIHNPYGKFPANARRPESFAVAADMNPWFKIGDIVSPAVNKELPQIIKLNDKTTWILGSSLNHPKRKIRGQNIIWADGHVNFEPLPNVGVDKDNIFTFQSTDKDPTEQDIQGGTNPTGRSPENDAKSKDDSFLAI